MVQKFSFWNLSLILILNLKSFVNTGAEVNFWVYSQIVLSLVKFRPGWRRHHKQFAFHFPLISFSLVSWFTSYSQTLLLRPRPFHKHASLWHWHLTLFFNNFYHFVLKFGISIITLSLVNGFTLYSHTMLLRSRPFHPHVVSSPWPSDDLDIQHCSLTICVVFQL